MGVAGYTLGGGVGLLARRYGFAADHLQRLRLVTADGRAHEIDADRAPELFWALRGAGRNGFGVVTELEFALFPLVRLYGGGIVWPAAAAADVLHAWREWAPTLPDELGTSVALLRVPRDAGWPAPLHDQTVVHLRFAGADVEATTGDALLSPMRALGTPLLDEVGELSPTATDAVHREPTAPAPVHDGGAALRDLPASGRRRPAGRRRRGRREPADAGGAARAGRGAEPGRRGARRRRRAVGRLRAARPRTRRRPGTADRAGAVPGATTGVGDAVAAVVDAVAPWSLGGPLPTFAGAGEPVELWSPRDQARLHLLRQAVDPGGMFAGPSPA